MDLFVINRYNDLEEENDQSVREAKHLNKLKEKIEQRKKVNLLLQKPLKAETTIKDPNDTIAASPKPLKSDERLDQYDVRLSNDTSNIEENPRTEYKVLGINEFEKKTKVKRVLPHWLSNPSTVSVDLQHLSCNIDRQNWLHPTLKSTLQSEGITHLFPVQADVTPFVLEQQNLPAPLWPRDVCISAPTGSGKTLSFVLPIIQILMNEVGRHARALIVLPVQELAAQVAKVFRKYCTNTGLRVALLSGSTPLKQEQSQLLKYTETSSWVSKVDIIVCTAGRLVEHLKNTKGFSLKHLKFLVIDEADRIMDHIQNDWLYHLDKHIKLQNKIIWGKTPILCWTNLQCQKASPHKLLFSATLSQDPEKLEEWGLCQPKLFSAGSKNEFEDDEQIRKYTTPIELTEKCIISDPEQKPLILYHLLAEEKWNRVLCFTNASQSAHRLTLLLNCMGEGRLKVAELSAALDRTTRESVLKKFHQSEINVLIGTDALARGIDIPDCDYVISYDLPRNIKTYIHRVGRTGRAGRKGCAVTMLLQNQNHLFKTILQSGGKFEIPELSIPPQIFDRLSSNYQNALHKTKQHIHEEIDSRVNKSKNLKRGFRLKNTKNVSNKHFKVEN